MVKARRDRLIWSAGAATLFVAVFAMGGAPRWALAAAAATIAIAVGLQLTSRRRFAERSPLMMVLLAATGLTALQAVPLPVGISQALSPTTASLIADSREFAGVASGLRPLTVDAPGTWRALLMLLLLVGVAFVALRLAASERGRYRLLAGVGAAAGLSAVVVGVHKAIGATSLYGLYEPVYASTRILGPLLNPNHLASFMTMGALVCGGLALYSRQPILARGLWVITSLGCVAVGIGTGSRGAVVALVIGLVLGLAVLILQRSIASEPDPRRRRASPWTTAPIAMIVLCALAMVVYVSSDKVGADLSATTAAELTDGRSKFAAWSSAETLIGESPWIGVGRGGFEPAFTRVYPHASFGTYSHVENEYLQAVVDWGVPGALLLGALLAWLAVVMLRRFRGGPLAAGGLAAVAAVAVHSAVDFGAELPGLAVPLVIVAATLSYVPLREAIGKQRRNSRVWRVMLIGSIVGGLVLVVPGWGRSLDEDHRQLSAQRPEIASSLAVLARHPLDYFSAGQAALAATRDGDPRAARLLNHALMLHPTHVGLHRAAAQMLIRAGRPKQAALEYRLALSGTMTPDNLLSEVVVRYPDDQLALLALPADHPNPNAIVRALAKLGRGNLAVLYYEQIVAAHPERLEFADYLLDLAVHQNNPEVAERVARDLLSRQPTLRRRLALARMLVRKGDHVGALTELADVERATGELADKFSAWLLRCDELQVVGKPDEARTCLEALASSELPTTRTQRELDERLLKLRAE